MLFNPAEKNKPRRWFDLGQQKVMERLLRMKQTIFLKKLRITKKETITI
jgi:hypothetical protein